MTSSERIISVIRKLRALATSSNEHEAALAAAKASEMLQQYNLSLTDIEDASAERDEKVTAETVGLGGGKGQAQYRWKVSLFSAIARYNFCEAIHSDTGWSSPTHARHTMILVGKAHDREVVLFLFDILSRQLEEWSKRHPVRNTAMEAMVAKELGLGTNIWGPRKSFLFGAVKEISARLHAQWLTFQRSNSKALALVQTTALALQNGVAIYVGKTKPTNLGERSDIVMDPDGYAAGQKAGREIEFQKGVGGKEVGAKALGSGR